MRWAKSSNANKNATIEGSIGCGIGCGIGQNPQLLIKRLQFQIATGKKGSNRITSLMEDLLKILGSCCPLTHLPYCA